MAGLATRCVPGLPTIVTGRGRAAGHPERGVGPGLGMASRLGYRAVASRASGGIGRRARFRSVCPKGRGGSTPPSRTWTRGQLLGTARRRKAGSPQGGPAFCCSRPLADAGGGGRGDGRVPVNATRPRGPVRDRVGGGERLFWVPDTLMPGPVLVETRKMQIFFEVLLRSRVRRSRTGRIGPVRDLSRGGVQTSGGAPLRTAHPKGPTPEQVRSAAGARPETRKSDTARVAQRLVPVATWP